jgi:hypothetical protein
MSINAYWHERLSARQPLRLEALRTVGFNMKVRENDTWPSAVAKQALRLDYLAWFEQVYLPPYLDSGYYVDTPQALPQRLDDLHFFTALSPFIHIIGREEQTRTYRVRTRKQHEGRWLVVKANRNFVRLCEWREHVAAFELATGLVVGNKLPDPSLENMETIATGVTVAITKLAGNRETMERAMGRAAEIDE